MIYLLSLLLFATSLSAQVRTGSFGTGYMDRLTVMQPGPSVNSLTNGLIAYYPLDEQSGARVDVVSGINLIENVPVGYASAIITNGAKFSSSAVLSNLSSTISDLTNSVSVSIWIYPSNSSAYATPVALRDTDTAGKWSIFASSTANDFRFIYWTNTTSLTVPFTWKLIDRTWTHVCFTFTNNTLIFYSNGISMQTNITGGPFQAGTRKLMLGKNASSESYFGGILDDFRIYSRPISSNEIWALSRTNLVYYGQ